MQENAYVCSLSEQDRNSGTLLQSILCVWLLGSLGRRYMIYNQSRSVALVPKRKVL